MKSAFVRSFCLAVIISLGCSKNESTSETTLEKSQVMSTAGEGPTALTSSTNKKVVLVVNTSQSVQWFPWEPESGYFNKVYFNVSWRIPNKDFIGSDETLSFTPVGSAESMNNEIKSNFMKLHPELDIQNINQIVLMGGVVQ